MAYAHFDESATVSHAIGRFRATAGEALTVGELIDSDFKAADATAGENPAEYIAIEDIASGDDGWFALEAILKKPTTVGAGGAATRGDHGGTAGDVLFLSTTAGDALEAPLTGILQRVGRVLSQDTILLKPSDTWWEDCEIVTSNTTLDTQDVGKLMATVTDAVVFTLPTTAAGTKFEIMNAGQDGDALISVSPASVDLIAGPDVAGADNKDWQNTKATARCMDMLVIEHKATVGYVTTKVVGTWAQET